MFWNCYFIICYDRIKLKLMALACSFFTRATLKNNENKLDDGTLSCQINKFMKICCTGWCVVGRIWACYFVGVIYCSHDNYVTLKALSDTRLLQILITPATHFSGALSFLIIFCAKLLSSPRIYLFPLGTRRKFQKNLSSSAWSSRKEFVMKN